MWIFLLIAFLLLLIPGVGSRFFKVIAVVFAVGVVFAIFINSLPPVTP